MKGAGMSVNDAEVIQKPDDVIIECLKIEEESNGNC